MMNWCKPTPSLPNAIIEACSCFRRSFRIVSVSSSCSSGIFRFRLMVVFLIKYILRYSKSENIARSYLKKCLFYNDDKGHVASLGSGSGKKLSPSSSSLSSYPVGTGNIIVFRGKFRYINSQLKAILNNWGPEKNFF
jgi:hypothetical protein